MMTTDRLRRILDLVQDSLREPDITGEELAGAAFLSRFHFDRLVRAALGEPPGAFRRRLLLERAAYQLSSTSRPVIEIAFTAGYGSPEAFTRAFGRAYGRSPSDYRQAPGNRELRASSGIHFHPEEALRMPTVHRSTASDILTLMLDHHLDMTGKIIDQLPSLDATVVDRPVELSIATLDPDPTLGSVSERLVSQLEMWVSVVDGGARITRSDATPGALRGRLDTAGSRFRDLVTTALARGKGDEPIVDTISDPPRTVTYGDMLAQVVTFSAVRRTMAIAALETAGIGGLGSGDPMQFVGGSGADAATIRRKPNTDLD